MQGIYDHPRLYAAAFSFRDIPREVDTLVECVGRFSRIPVSTVLELACGHGPHSNELVRRGYRYVGLDLNPAMLAAVTGSAAKADSVSAVLADMCHFSLDIQVDLAFVALGSLYAQSTSDLESHFRSLSAALRPGGLYLLDWCVNFSPAFPVSESWEVTDGDLHLRVQFQASLVDPVEQIVQDSISIEGTDTRTPVRINSVDTKRIMYPQEFLLLVRSLVDFEFVGWWNDWDLSDPIPSGKPINRPIALLRRV
jgi:SAM-dependent methyltransferase